MLIDSYYKNLIIGSDYLALILANIELGRNESLLYLNDDAVTMLAPWNQYISLIEVKSLELLGKHYEITPLVNIRDFIRPIKLHLLQDSLQIILGLDVNSNLLELKRKMGLLQGQSLDNISMMAELEVFASQLVSEVFYFSNIHNLNAELFNKSPEFLKNLYNEISKILDIAQPRNSTRQLLYQIQCLSQWRLSPTYKPLQLWWLCSKIVAPHYLIDTNRLNQALYDFYKRKNGQYKKTSINQWIFEQNKFKAVELNTLEAVIRSDRVMYVGQCSDREPFEIKQQLNNRYYALKFKIDYPSEIFDLFKESLILKANTYTVGTENPFCIVEYISAKELHFSYVTEAKPASKHDFYIEAAKEYIINFFRTHLAHIDEQTLAYCIHYMYRYSFWAETTNHAQALYDQSIFTSNTAKPTKLVEKITQKPIKAISYWGPQKIRYYGLLDYFVEIRQS
jgi:hypothetical protein